MILPALGAVIIFEYLPMYGILVAFKNYSVFDGVMNSPWARSNGFEHFIDFLTLPAFGLVMRNTIVIAIMKLGFLSLPPVILAVMLNEIKNGGFKRVTQSISYFPHFISWVVLGGLMFNFLNPTDGLINKVLVDLGIIDLPINFIASNTYFWPILIVSDFWKGVGWGSIIYLAVISTVDPNLYEAIEIDGGGRWSKTIHITWPHLMGTFMILFILACGRIMSGAGDTFEQVYVLGNVANRRVSDILDTYILRLGLENGRYSFSAAVGLFKSIINLIILVTANTLSKRLTEKSLF